MISHNRYTNLSLSVLHVCCWTNSTKESGIRNYKRPISKMERLSILLSAVSVIEPHSNTRIMTTRSSLTSSWPLVSFSVDQLCSFCLHHTQTQALKRLLRAFPRHSGSAVWSWVCRSSAFSTADAQSFTTKHKVQASRWADCVSLPTPHKQEIQISGGALQCTNTDKMSHLWNAKYLFSHTRIHTNIWWQQGPLL